MASCRFRAAVQTMDRESWLKKVRPDGRQIIAWVVGSVEFSDRQPDQSNGSGRNFEGALSKTGSDEIAPMPAPGGMVSR